MRTGKGKQEERGYLEKKKVSFEILCLLIKKSNSTENKKALSSGHCHLKNYAMGDFTITLNNNKFSSS
jgi:hypothetical protein